ncbi:MAG: hypothetical protein K8T20_00800 [Planctomycetes bacterium]|nr:hypothetical protein [Planctomycetota bacterium]
MPEPQETPSLAKRRGLWARSKWLRVGLLVVLGGFTAIVLFGVARHTRRWNEFLEHHAARRSESPLGPVARPALAGPALPGDAMDDYCEGMKRLFGNAKVILSMEKPLGDIVDAPEYSLEAFRTGTRRSHCSYIHEWPWAFNGSLLVSRLLEYSAQRHRKAGRLSESLLEIQVLAQLGLDLGNSPETVAAGHGMLHDAIHELVELIRDARVTAEILERIETTVAFMDRNFPTALTVMRRMGVLIGEQIIREGGMHFQFRRSPPFVETDRAFAWFDDQWEPFLPRPGSRSGRPTPNDS